MRTPRDQERQRLVEVTRRRIEEITRARDTTATVEHDAAPDPGPTPPAPTVRGTAAGPGRHARRPVSLPGRLGGWVVDRLPVTVRGRVHLGAAQLGLVALVVALGLVVTAWWTVRAGGRTDVVAPPRPAVQGPESVVPVAGPGDGDGDGDGDQTVVVDVAGRVRHPGIAELPAGSRVVDALEAAGGVRRGVDLSTLNLARVLVDGEQVLVGVRAVPATGAATGPVAGSASAGGLVSINTADQATLETLPGVGPVTAAAIVGWREENGAFGAVEELLEVSGIGPATLAELMPHVTL